MIKFLHYSIHRRLFISKKKKIETAKNEATISSLIARAQANQNRLINLHERVKQNNLKIAQLKAQ